MSFKLYFQTRLLVVNILYAFVILILPFILSYHFELYTYMYLNVAYGKCLRTPGLFKPMAPGRCWYLVKLSGDLNNSFDSTNLTDRLFVNLYVTYRPQLQPS